MFHKHILFQNESKIFPPTTGGGEKLAQDTNIPLLGKLPLDPRIGKALMTTLSLVPCSV